MDSARFAHTLANAMELLRSLWHVAGLPLAYVRTCFRDPNELTEENLVLRRQIAILLERGAKPRRLTGGERLVFAWLSRRCAADAVVLFKPATLIRTSFGLKALRTPRRSPKANAVCDRVSGTIRRECLDHVIPLGEEHLRRLLREWVGHYNCGREPWPRLAETI